MSWHSRSSSRSCASPGTRRRGPRAKAAWDAWDTEPAGAAVLAAVRAWKLSGSSLQSCRAGCVLLLAGAPRRALYVTGICSAVVAPLLSPPWHSRCPGLLPKLMHCYHGETQATASCCPLRTRAARYHEPLATSLRLCNQSLIHSLDRTDIASVRAKMSRDFTTCAHIT